MVKNYKKYLKYIMRQLSFEKKINFLILYATSQCNFQCQTCFFHQQLHGRDDMTLEEYKKISDNLGDISILLISGGEPFMNPNLEDICSMFIEKNKVDTLYLPTNAYFSEKILLITKLLLKKFSNIIISVNPSLDGTKEYHENLRGMPGSFSKLIKTINGLELLKEKYDNLQIIVNSVMHHDNLDELKKIAVFLRSFNIDEHAFELIRGDNRDKSLSGAELDEITRMHDFILDNRRWYLNRNVKTNFFSDMINKVVTIGHLAYLQSLKESALKNNKWPFKCEAGESIAVIYPDGSVTPCELIEPIGNIKTNNYKILDFFENKKFLNQLKINNIKCSNCTHVCFLNASLAKDLKSWIRIFIYYFKK